LPTVLLVEDNDDVREMMSVALELSGITVLAAANGREALDLLDASPAPCVVLLDLMMPVMDGWELRAALNAHPEYAAIPVVIVSAMTEDTAAKLGAAAYLPKPVDIDRMLDIVCEHCRNASRGGEGEAVG
jgi:CheY-like chemotaxis protein